MAKETTELFYRAGTSDKFYRAELDGRFVTFTWGRRGSSGQSQVFEGETYYSARREYDRRVEEKQAKGYRQERDSLRNTPVTPPQPLQCARCGELAHFGPCYVQQPASLNPTSDRTRRMCEGCGVVLSIMLFEGNRFCNECRQLRPPAPTPPVTTIPSRLGRRVEPNTDLKKKT